MELTLDRYDLAPEHRDTPTMYVRFEHLTLDAQRAVLAVGRAQYRTSGSYNAVYPPKPDPSKED